jgi:hypothetical protein
MAKILERIIRAGAARLFVKAAKSTPVIGTAIAIGLIGYEVKKKGLIKGVLNTALDATPVVGVTKNAIEVFTGDWLPDKPSVRAGKNPARSDETALQSSSPSLPVGNSSTPETDAEDGYLVTTIRKNTRR